MAGWALGLAIVPCCGGITTVVGIGLAIAVLVKSRHGVDHGKALAIGALVVGPLWVVLALIGIATGMVSDLTSDAQRDDSGRVTQRSDQSTLTLRNGDCFDDKRLSGLTAEEGDSKGSTQVTAVPCYQAHQFEVFNLLELEPAPYPGGDELGRRASGACAKEFRTFIGVPLRRSRLAMYSLYPDSAGWEDGRRTVRCVVGQNGELTTGTLRATRW